MAYEICVTLCQEDLLNLLKGIPAGPGEYSMFSGNQWCESWAWDLNTLRKLGDEQLWAMYCKLSNKKHSRINGYSKVPSTEQDEGE